MKHLQNAMREPIWQEVESRVNQAIKSEACSVNELKILKANMSVPIQVLHAHLAQRWKEKSAEACMPEDRSLSFSEVSVVQRYHEKPLPSHSSGTH